MKRFICLITALLCIYSAFAQITTASLSGVVTNQSQEKLVGATVILSHPTTGSEYAVVADVQGRYSLHGIRPSDGYILEVSYVGCESVRREGITLRVGDMHTEDIVLRQSTTLDAVVVTAEQVQSSQMTSKFDESLISQMPSVSRSLYDVVRLMPQAVATKSGGMSYGGVANRYNQFMINGMANNDMYGLSSSGTNGGLSNANPIALDAIEQLEVVVASYDVRMSGFGGGAINAITKSGTNEFKGSAYTYYNDHNFYGTTAGRNVAERKKLENQSTQIYGATLGGAIIKNKLFFFLSGEFNHEASPSSYYLGYNGALLDGAELQRISDRYKALTGYDGGGTGRRNVAQRSGSLLATLDWHINSRNRLSASYSYLDARAEEYGNSLSSFTFNGSGYANYSTAHYLALALESRLSDHTHNSLRIGYSRVGDGRKPDVGGDLPSVIIRHAGTTGGVAINIGNNRYAGINDLTQNVVTLTDDLIMERGSHSITLGMHHEFYDIHNRYLANSYGTYTYNSVADFENDLASLYEYNYTDPNVTGSTTWGPKFRAAELNLYAQDRWAIGRGLHLTYGVRATLPLIFNSPTANEEFNRGAIAHEHNIRIGDVPRAQLLISPRIGVTWMRNYDHGQLTIDGGVGVFTGQIPFVWIVNNYSNTGVEQKGLRLTATSDGGQIVKPAANFSVKPSPTSQSNTRFMLNAMNRHFRYPQNLKASAAVSYTSNNGWTLRAEALYTKTLHNAVFKNLAIEPTGEKIYTVKGAEASALPAYRTATTDYSAVYYLDNTSRGYSYSLSGSVSKSFEWGLSVMASYIFGHSYAVCDVPSTSSSSNWNRTYALDLNNPELTFSAYDVPHKVSLAVNYNKRYSPLFDLSASLVYQATSGQRYSYCFGEAVDFNGDGTFGSTLMYIPTESEMQNMLFADDTSREKWNNYIEDNAYLSTHRGSFAERNAMQTPMEHRLDLHLAHGFYFGAASGRKVELSLDVMNLGNLLCRHWGAYYNVSNVRLQPVTISAAEDGQAVYRFTGAEISPSDLLSRWHMQIGARIVF